MNGETWLLISVIVAVIATIVQIAIAALAKTSCKKPLLVFGAIATGYVAIVYGLVYANYFRGFHSALFVMGVINVMCLITAHALAELRLSR